MRRWYNAQRCSCQDLLHSLPALATKPDVAERIATSDGERLAAISLRRARVAVATCCTRRKRERCRILTHVARGVLHLCSGRVQPRSTLAALHALDVSAFCAFECESFDAPANARCASCAERGRLQPIARAELLLEALLRLCAGRLALSQARVGVAARAEAKSSET